MYQDDLWGLNDSLKALQYEEDILISICNVLYYPSYNNSHQNRGPSSSLLA